jgi:collagenase-like PrtC family protease
MIHFNLGYNFDESLIGKIKELNEKYKDKCRISEVYGSLRFSEIYLPTARPDYRIPDISIDKLKCHIEKLRDINVRFNYTLNSPNTSIWFHANYSRIIEILNYIKPNIITVSHPLILQQLTNTDFKIEISTILDVNNLNAVKMWLEINPNIEKICLSITVNRDFQFLTGLSMTPYASKVELLANEFCNVKGIPCQNFFRKACYDLHSIGGNKNKKFNNFPLGWCSKSRYSDSSSWIKANVILPRDIPAYRSLGINKFKLSGRTMPTKFIVKIAESYMSFGETGPDNLLELWGHVDNINTRDLMEIPNINISMRKMYSNGFIDFFIRKRIKCSDTLCSHCGYCERMYEKTKKTEKS